MTINKLSDDNLNIIFDYINQVLDMRCLQCSCKYFNSNYPKKYIEMNIIEHKKKITNIFPELIIKYLGGYNDILHYYLLDKCLNNIEDIENLTLTSLHKSGHITIQTKKYDIILGMYSRNLGFISFSDQCMKSNTDFEGNTENNIDYIIYQKYNHINSDWYITEFNYFTSNTKIYSKSRRGLFRTIRLIEFNKGYHHYTHHLEDFTDVNTNLCNLIQNIVINTDKKRHRLSRY